MLLLSLGSQLTYTVCRHLILLPFLLLIDQSLFVAITLVLLSSDIAINIAGASQADTYVRLTKGSTNDFELLRDRYVCALILQLPILCIVGFFVDGVLELLAIVVYTITNIHTLFSQKIALNEGKLYVVSIDYFLKAAAMTFAYFYLEASSGDTAPSESVLLFICVGQALSMIINAKIWGTSLFNYGVVAQWKNLLQKLIGRESLFIPYALMAIMMRGEPLIVGNFFDQSPNIYVYFSFIALASYLPSLLASGPTTNLIAQLPKSELQTLSFAVVIIAWIFSVMIGWYWTETVSGLIYPNNVISGTIPLVITTFLTIMTNLMKPKLTLDGNLRTLTIVFLITSACYILLLIVFNISYEFVFLCGAGLRFFSVLISVWGSKIVA
jgi:hypothetical protein